MTLCGRSVLRGARLAVCVLLATTGLAYGQATSTFNGRVLDQGDAVLPGVTVTAINVSTGVARTTVTNADGSYYMPGLEPGVYQVKTDLTGDRKLGLFAEFFNLLNTNNFGSAYTGNSRSATFRQSTGFIPGIGYPRQVQLGARFLF